MTSNILPPLKYKVIAIVGGKRCGKDTIASFLGNYGYENWKVAGKLKKICAELFGFNNDQLETDAKEIVSPKWGVSPRHIMQVIGTDIVQFELKKYIPKIDRTFWIERLCEEFLSLTDRPNIVISDVRFMHEYLYLKSVFGNDLGVIKVLRPSMQNTKDAHISEHEWQSIPEDILVSNDSTVDALYEKLKIVI